jgi:diacylglycerol kinase family enzyme
VTDVTVVLNSASTSANNPGFTDQVAQSFGAAGIDAAIRLATGAEMTRVVEGALRDGSRVIVAGGGDGTISTIASLVAGTDAALGVLPLGTLNHFAKDTGIPLDLTGAVRTIAAGRILMADLGDANGRRFINNVSVGLYPSVVSEREKQQRHGRGKRTAAGLATLQVWREYRRVRVTIRTGHEHRMMRTPFVLVGNNEYRLDGVSFGRRSSLTRGQLHLCAAPDMTRKEVIGVLLSALTGRMHRVEHFESLCVPELSIDARRQHLQVSVDGELAIFATPIRFQILPAALRVLVPSGAG